MKVKKSLYNVLQYFSTIDDTLTYKGKGVLITKDKVGSGFVEVELPDFFDKTLVIRSLSKFLRLFTFGKAEKGSQPESLQDWTLDETFNQTGSVPELCLTSPGHVVKVRQGLQQLLEMRERNVLRTFDQINFDRSLKFQITNQQYKQIISDCSLLDLDMITFSSISNSVIRVILRRKDNSTNKDLSTYDIEVEHEHKDISVSIWLNTFSLIDATDHQIEFGFYKTPDEVDVPLVKTKSFCDNDYVVKKVIIGF